jgi:hypothetical protein
MRKRGWERPKLIKKQSSLFVRRNCGKKIHSRVKEEKNSKTNRKNNICKKQKNVQNFLTADVFLGKI